MLQCKKKCLLLPGKSYFQYVPMDKVLRDTAPPVPHFGDAPAVVYIKN